MTEFPKPILMRRKCGFCKQVPDPIHNSLTCPVRKSMEQTRRRGPPKKPLMSLSNRKQGKERIKELIDYFDNFCEVNREDKKDVLAFEYRRRLITEGKVKSARTFESFHQQPAQILVKPLSPRKTASRIVVSGQSWNKSRDDFTYMTQHGLPVYAGPGDTDLYRWSVSPMNVSFNMESIDKKFKSEYKAPEKPIKPGKNDWTNREERAEKKIVYARELRKWKQDLRPITGKVSLGAPRTPEAVKPNLISAGYPYPNLLAHSLFDARKVIKDNLAKYNIKEGIIKVHTHASDGCDGFGNWDLITQKTNVDLPDHGLSYDCKILNIKTTNLENNFTLFEDSGVAVNACKPVMRAAANENDHFSTHLLTIPIERQRSAMEKVELTVKIDDEISLVSTFTIDPTKVDLKYNQEQSGLGDRNFGCHLCTTPRSEWFEKESILKGFPLNRTVATTVEEAERRRVNPDSDTQEKLKLASKGVTHAPIYTAEHTRHLVDPLHNGLSFGRALADLLVRLNSDIFCRTIEASVQPLYEATKLELKNRFLQIFGFNPFINLNGPMVALMYNIENHEKIIALVPDVHREVFEHWMDETRFYLGFIFHLDPHNTFNLDEIADRFESMLIFFAEKMAWWSPPDYFHIGPAHAIQLLLLKDDKGILKYKNLTQTGTQDKENKNHKQRVFFTNLARKNDNQNAIGDVLIRDMEESSLEMREHGLTMPVHKCGVCGLLGHHRNSKKCPRVQNKGKFIDMSSIEGRLLNRSQESDTDRSIDSDISEVSLEETRNPDKEIEVNESIEDFELEEVLEDSGDSEVENY